MGPFSHHMSGPGDVQRQALTAAPLAASPQIQGGEPETAANKKRTIPFKEVECLAFSFKNLACIDNLRGLDNLTKLQIDNNQVTKIENLGHLVRRQLACVQEKGLQAGSLHHAVTRRVAPVRVGRVDPQPPAQTASIPARLIQSFTPQSLHPQSLAMCSGLSRATVPHGSAYPHTTLPPF